MEYIQRLIAKFWTGRASEQERKEILNYLDQRNKGFKHSLNQLYHQALRDGIPELLGESKAAELLEQIHIKAGIVNPNQRPTITTRQRRLRVMAWGAAAACLLVTLGVALHLYLLQGNVGQIPIERVSLEQTIIQEGNRGMEDMVVGLPDCSVIYLAPGSAISYTKDFAVTQRDIFLEGVARFCVTKDPSPFTVYANGYSTTALGTEFIVNTNEKGKTIITLLSGKIVVAAASDTVPLIEKTYLYPGDKLEIRNLTGELALEHGQPNAKSNAVHGETPRETSPLVLHFDRTPLRTVFAQLQDIGQWPIVYTDDAAKELFFTGKIPLARADTIDHSTVQEALSSLCQEFGLTCTHQDGQLIIARK